VGIFYECRNNGVIALVNERIFHSLNLMGDIRADVYAASSRAPQAVQSVVTKGLQHLMTPIFTFSISHRIRNRNWFTGGSYLYDAVRKHMRATNHGLCGSYSFYVPFSNGLERGHGGSDGTDTRLLPSSSPEEAMHFVASSPLPDRESNRDLKMVL